MINEQTNKVIDGVKTMVEKDKLKLAVTSEIWGKNPFLFLLIMNIFEIWL